MKAYALTNVGVSRNTNQDYVYFSEKNVGNLPNILVVADGMGGHRAGEVASEQAVNAVLQSIKENDNTDKISLIETAISVANDKVLDMATSDEKFKGMGTTLVVATLEDGILYVANVGDSRLYLIDDDDIKQITRDHSLVQEMVSIGELDKDSARNHSNKNVITRAIGVEKKIMADFFEVEVSEKTKILLCSDGLTNMVEDSEINRIICENKGAELEVIVKKLIDEANENGGLDNIAVVLAEV
ncbi:MAG: Stp1/IreP family PP2C-type Ser/Thr phosphatase [Lachnospiraceae bacterium]|nr:Stp1/IreP family PP2C-type Ser/Thr phosphatase [Lachnospiraceae bacterium]